MWFEYKKVNISGKADIQEIVNAPLQTFNILHKVKTWARLSKGKSFLLVQIPSNFFELTRQELLMTGLWACLITLLQIIDWKQKMVAVVVVKLCTICTVVMILYYKICGECE